MTPDDRNRDETLRQPRQATEPDVESVLEAEEEASAEASQRPGPRGRIGGLPREGREPADRARADG
jgi:hypothetical protein